MKSFKVKLKDGNFIKAFKNEYVYATIKLENGRELGLTFVQSNRTIEVTSIDGEANDRLSEEERIAIIERILNDCATFIKSILKVSISLYIEEYTLIDCTISPNKRYSYNITILEEFVKSKYSIDTKNKTLQALIYMNEQLKQISDKIGKEEVKIAMPDNLSIVERTDVTYFLTHLLKEYFNKVKIKSVKGNILLLKPVE